MKHLTLLFIAISLISCSKTEKKEQPFDSFVYSFSAQNLDYSIKFNESDTVYFQKRFPEPVTNYYTIAKDIQKENLIALVEKINFTNYDSIYEQENLSDGDGLKFYKLKNGKESSIYIYGSKAPKDLYQYAAKFNNLSKNFDFQPYKGKVDFGNLKHIELPTPPPLRHTTN